MQDEEPVMISSNNRLYIIVDEDKDYYYGSDFITYEVIKFEKNIENEMEIE